MAKRTLALILITFFLLSALITAGGVLFAPKSPFYKFDANRKDSLSQSLGQGNYGNGSAVELPTSNRYIVKFKESASLFEIERVLKELPYTPLDKSEQRIFAAVFDDYSFFEENKDIIDYFEPDLERNAYAVTDDPIQNYAYEQSKVGLAWDLTLGANEITVAVLDTGVDRNHEDLKNVNILSGYDAVKKTAGVNEDTAGHGTGVVGIIAAEANNGLGIAGVAHGVTILPIKVSTTSTTIYSSDLIAGIRFAADAGAKIINMSIGGYSPSYAEQEAVNYALSKGCILIAAAGNGGNRPYSDLKSYPASYEGVISVGSCDSLGQRSSFSQYNEFVDIAAPGEMITMPCMQDGLSSYCVDSGTSFSCAIVSGIAALAASRIDAGIRFDGDEFLSLVMNMGTQARNDELGYGIIDALVICESAVLPIVTGVVNGGKYSDSVIIGFNRGEATLDGEKIDDGESVISNGLHSLTIKDGDYEKNIIFRLNYTPLSYKFKEFAAFSTFEFERGLATLDGFPYKSGERISASGRHDFILIDGSERLEKEFYLQYALPTVYGVENGGIYDKPIEIKVIGDGSAELDGEEIFGEAAVCESGKHTLTVRSGNGAVTAEYSFEINFPQANSFDIDYAMASAAIDSEHGYICLYGESLVGVRIYDIESPEKYMHFLHIGTVYSHAFIENSLVLYGENGLTLIRRDNAKNGISAVSELGFIGGVHSYTFAEGEIFGFTRGGLRRINIDGSFEDIRLFDFDIEKALYSDGLFCIFPQSEERVVYIYNPSTDGLFSFETDYSHENAALCFGNGFLAVKNRLYNVTNGECELEFCSTYAIKIENGHLFTDNRIIEIASGREVGSFPYLVSDIEETEDKIYVYGIEPRLTVTDKALTGVNAYGAAERNNKVLSVTEEINVYRTDLFYDKNLSILSAEADNGLVFAIFRDRNLLYSFDSATLTENEAIPLRFAPESISASGGYITVIFKNSDSLYLAPTTDIYSGYYLTLPNSCTSATVFNGRLYTVSGGRLSHSALDGSGSTVMPLHADEIKSDGERLYLLLGESLSVYDASLTLIHTVTATDGFVLGDCVAVDGNIFDPSLLNIIASVKEEIYAINGGAAITKEGVFDLAKGRYVGKLGVKKTESAIITSDNIAISFGSALISVCRQQDGSPLTASPEIVGVTDGTAYLDGVKIEFDRGIGYLDGAPIESGVNESGAGAHTLLIALPCGQSLSVSFTIEARIERIEFLIPDRTMSVGEHVSLRVMFLPEGAGSVPVVFSTASDGLTVSENGEVTAISVGTHNVTALAETPYGSFDAVCTITVRDDLILFTEESGITIDRDNGLIMGIPAGTQAKDLISFMYNGKNARVVDEKGKTVKGAVGTGNRVIIEADGEITDELTAVIVGDTDGDGYISAYDLYILKRVLRGYSYDAAYAYASDVNKNGLLADNDYRMMKNILLSLVEYDKGSPSANLFGLATVQAPSHIESGSEIEVALCVSGCKYARGFSGVLDLGEGLELISHESAGWEVGAKKLGGGKIGIFAHGDNGEESKKAFKTVIKLRLRVTASEGETIKISSSGLTASFADGCRTIRFEEANLFVFGALLGDLNIEIHNASSFNFDPSKNVLNAVIPYNSALADISVTRAEGQTVSITGAVLNDTGVGNVTVTISNPDGSSLVYTIRVQRDDEPHFDTNCRLATLEIEGHELTPRFNPDIYEYSASVPHGTKEIKLYYVAQNPTASVIVSGTVLQGDETPIVITVISPDGESLTYTINVSVLPPVEVSDETSEHGGDGDGVSAWTVVAILGALATMGLIIFSYIKLYKHDEAHRDIAPDSPDETDEATETDENE